MGKVTRSTTVTSIPESPKDLTGQIFGTISDHVAAGGFGNVYRCEWRRPCTDPVKVAVKVIKFHTSEEDLRRIRREIAIWARLVHDNIVSLLGTTQRFGPSPALVSLWFPHGTLLRLIADKGGELSIRSKLKLLRDIASGLHYLHCSSVVHGDLTSSNILVDIKEGEYKACLTDFGLSTVLGGLLGDCAIEGSIVRYGAVRWAAPELLPLDRPPDAKPTKQNDIYSFGRVMYHILTRLIPWDGLDDLLVFQKILSGEKITRPETPHATPDITDARWNEIEQCWSVDAPARPSALMIMDFLTSELAALGASTDDDALISEAQEGSQTASLGMGDPVQTSDLAPRCLSPSEMEDFGSNYERPPHETDELPLSSGSVGRGSQPQTEGTTPMPRSSSGIDAEIMAISPISLHSTATASSLSLSRPFNVLVFGETGVGKSSVINLIAGQDVAKTSPDGPTCTVDHVSYEISLGNLRFKLCEVSSIAPMNYFLRLFAKWRLKRSYKKLYKDDGVYLLLYCMRNSRAQGTLVRDYKFFTSIVGSTAGHVPVAAVVTHLEDYPLSMDVWWTKNEENLRRQGMQFSRHACITSLPDDPDASPALRVRRQRSEQAIRRLICQVYQAGRAS